MIHTKRLRKALCLLSMGAILIGLRVGERLFGYIGNSVDSVHVSDDIGVLKTSHISGIGSSRHLLSMVNCTPRAVEQFPRDIFTQEERVNGALVVHILVSIYMFLGLAIVCDFYFVPALEVICNMLNLQTDVAGATFMAAGSSAPELVTATIGVFIAKDDVGLSAVVGSAIYNVMFVISICGFAASTAIQLNWWPLFRDSAAYLLSILVLVSVIMDELIYWYESIILLAMYVGYIVFMVFNQQLEKRVNEVCVCCPSSAQLTPDQVVVRYEKISNGTTSHSDEHSPMGDRRNGFFQSEDSLSSSDDIITEIHKPEPGDKDESICRAPSGKISCFIWAIGLPLSILMFFTIPDCRKPRYRKWFILTFIMSLVWLSIMSTLMVWMVTIIGFTVGLPDSVMSLTFIAFGVSLPDVVASVLVIRDGFGDMAVSNAVGSNVFDILVCLGLPWFLKTCVINPGSPVVVYSSGLMYSAITLLGSVLVLLGSIALNKWMLDVKVSIVFMIVYITYSILASCYELNVFGYFHPKECESDY